MKRAKIGNIPWNKNIKGIQIAWNKGTKGIMVAWNKGKKASEETKKRLRDSHLIYWAKRRETLGL
jgi:hypothetical protein